MEVITKKELKKRKTRDHIEIGPVHDIANDPAYQQHPSMYFLPPTEEVSVQEFENFAISRLKLLSEFDHARISGLAGKDLQTFLTNAIAENMPIGRNTYVQDVRRDVLSHWTLRLCFCKSTEKEWFLKQEADLFAFRLKNEFHDKKMSTFLEENNLDFPQVSASEREELRPQLEKILRKKPQINEAIYKVHWLRCLTSVASRRVLLKGGMAFIPEDEFKTFLVSEFRSRLSSHLAQIARKYPAMQQQLENVQYILSSSSLQNMQSGYKINTGARSGAVTLAQIPMVAKRSFPLCMQSLHTKLHEVHHLKHFSRMQLGLFLKGIGLSLEDSLRYWRDQFSQVVGADKFEKQYAYNIRHNYGREGKKTDYTPYGCIKIITQITGASDTHGCPFKTLDPDLLKKDMISKGLKQLQVQEIVDLVRNSHYQIACAKFYEFTHAGSTPVSIQHPNQYFDLSEKFYEDKAEKIKEEAPENKN